MIRLSSETWDVTSVFEEAVEDVEEDLAEVGMDPEIREEENEYGYTISKSWRFSRLLGLYEQRVSLDYQEGKVFTGSYVSPFLFVDYVLVVVLYCVYLFLLPDLTVSIFHNGIGVLFLPMLAVVTAAVGVSFDSLVDVEDNGLLISWFSSPYPTLAFFAVLAAIFSRFSFLFSPFVSAGIVAVLIAGSVLKILTDVYIPRGQTRFPKLLIIPFQAVFYRLVPFILLLFVSLGPLAFVSGFDVSLEFYSELDRDMPLIGLVSVFSDFTASFAGSEALATLYHGLPTLLYLFISIISLLVFSEYWSCKCIYTRLRNSRISPSGSTVVLTVSAAVFIFSNLFVLLFAGLATVILAYAFTSLVLLPPESTLVVSTSFYSNILVQPENIIRGSLVAVEQGVTGFPILSARVYTFVYYLLFLTPLVVTGGLWISHMYSLYQQKQSYSAFEPANIDSVSPDVVTVDSDFPVLSPVSTGLASTSILVSSRIIEELEEEELEAVLMHEEYHVKNRDLLFNLVASVFSLGFGGRNALLAFYGYPGIEGDADQYAVEKTSKETLLSANQEMYKLLNSFEIEDEDLALTEKPWDPFYRFYFGDFLLGTSNKSYLEREMSIADMEE